jgi:hypothetical protein
MPERPKFTRREILKYSVLVPIGVRLGLDRGNSPKVEGQVRKFSAPASLPAIPSQATEITVSDEISPVFIKRIFDFPASPKYDKVKQKYLANLASRKPEVLKHSVFFPKYFIPESNREHHKGEWIPVGPDVKVLPGEDPDGIRAAAVSKTTDEKDEFLIIAGTWDHGLQFGKMAKDGRIRWVKDIPNDAVGINRDILMLDNTEYSIGDPRLQRDARKKAVAVCDWGLQIISEGKLEDDYQVVNTEYPDNFLEFAQTGCLHPDGDLLVGGMGGVYKIHDWKNPQSSMWNKQNILPVGECGEIGETIMIRSVVVDPKDPNIVYAGGWSGYSGQEQDDTHTRPLKGVGVWRINLNTGFYENILPDDNVNCLFIHPENPNIIIAGLEGFGDVSSRIPHPEYPIMKISLDKGKTWNNFTPPKDIYKYDLVSPQRAFSYNPRNKRLQVSCWGGPIYETDLPGNITIDQIKNCEDLHWRLLGDVLTKKDFHSGHLCAVNQGSRRILVTGSMFYWIRPIDHIPPFSPLHEWIEADGSSLN